MNDSEQEAANTRQPGWDMTCPSGVCRNQGMALAERECGYCHEGPCDEEDE